MSLAPFAFFTESAQMGADRRSLVPFPPRDKLCLSLLPQDPTEATHLLME